MTNFERFEREFFSRLKSSQYDGYPFRPYQFQIDFEIQTLHVREKLLEWYRDGLISLDLFSNGIRRPEDFPTTEDFFELGNQVGNIRAKLLARGAEHFEQLQESVPTPIGFHAK